MRRRNRSGLARPYIWRLSILTRLMCPSMLPELHWRVRPAVTAPSSQAGDEGLQCGVAGGGGGGHPVLEVASAAAGHQGGEFADPDGDDG
jgi:hypothetical protein